MENKYTFKLSTIKLIKSLLLLLFIIVSTLKMNAQGNTCALATPITIDGACLPTTPTANNISDGTEDAPLVATLPCSLSFGREGWFTFTVPAGPDMSITIIADASNRNLALQLISSTSSCSGLATVTCVNTVTTAGLQTETLTQTLSPGIYYLKVVNVGTGNMTLTSLCVQTTCVTPVDPGNPTSNSPQCLPTGVTLTRTGTPPAGETWYWQTTSGGTSTVNSGATYAVTTSGTYYIRSRNNAKLCWSTGEGSLAVVVNPLPANPGNPTSNSPQCLPTGVTLTRSGTVPAGETWYWQTTAGGTSTVNSAATNVVTTTGTYYIRAQNNTTGCWSAGSGSLAIVVNALPASPGNPTSNSPQCATPGVTLTRAGSVPAGETWYWQTASGGTSTASSGANFVVATSGTYYIRSRNNTTLCWSSGEGSLTVVVNALPANPGNPTSNSPQCISPGVTLTSSGSAPVGETWYWQTVSGGTSIASSSATYTVTTSGTYYIRSRNNTTLCWSSGEGSLAVVISTLPTAAITPSPTTGATGVCYSGAGTITSVSWAATAGATSYDVYFGAGSLPALLTANVATNSYTTGTLLASTTYFWRVVAKNACGDGPTSATWTFTTAASPCVLTYCTPTYANGPGTVDQITNVTLGTLNNSSGASATPYYTFYNAATIPNLTQTLTASVSVTLGSDPNQYVAVWIDFNQDGIFQTTEGAVSANAGANGTVVITIPVPVGAILGNTRMRVRGGNDTALTTAQACGASSSGYGETEDYIVNIIGLPVCTTPTTQPTALVLIPGGTSIAGNFTAASPLANNYLVVINTTGVAPTPINGTTYSIGNTIGSSTVVDIDTNTSFVANGLSLTTTYYVFVFSYNSICSGGPLYLTTSPLNGTTTTLATNYCIPSGNLDCVTNGDYIANVTINTLNNSTTCNAGGYTNFAATGTQTTTLIRGNTFNLSMGTGPGNKKHGAAVWIDFNQNSLFTDAGEYFFIGNGVIANSTNTIAITIPIGATLGTTRMRVRYGQKETMVSTMSCTMTGAYGETEDYTLTIADPIVCVAPTTQPTVLLLNSTGSTVSGSFTAPSPAPNNYLVVYNTTGIAPTPVNTTSYTIGGTVGAGNTVVDIDSNVTFTATGLTSLTTYYFFVYSFNSACSGGPTYNVTSPLTGTIATIASNYCIPSVTSGQQSLGYFSEVSFVGTLNDVSNYSTYSSSPLGYQDFTGLTNLSIQAQGEGVNITVQALNSSFMKAWVDWNKDGDFSDTGELVYDTGGISTYSTTFGFIIPPAQALGNYRIRIRLNSRDFTFPEDPDSTPVFDSCGNINWGGETEDYLFTVAASCNSLIATVTDGRTCGPGTVDLVASSLSAGVTEYRWYSTPTGATLVGTSPTGSWTTPSISTTATYYVTCYNGCESLVRTAVNAIISPIPTLTYLPTNPVVCGEDVGVELSATGDVEEVFLIDEKFTSGLGTFTNTNILSTAENANSQWQNHTSTFVLTPISGYNVWFPAISTGVNGNSFAMSTSDVGGVTIHNQMASATLNSSLFTSLTLSMRLFYSRYYIDGTALGLDYVTIDVSTNGGTAWTEIKRYTEDVGIGTRFETVTFDLSSYINQTNLKVRVRYYGEWCDGLAVDDIKLYGNRPSTDLNWTTAIPAFLDAPCTIPYDSNFTASTIYVKPSLAQLELGSFSFLATAILANGCSTSQTITITNTSKIWQGGTNWETAANWKPVGVPDATNCVIIPSTSVIPGSSYQAFAKNLTIKPAGNLEILSTSNLTVTDFIKLDALGVFTVRNNASLVQINDAAANSIVGSFSMDRTTTIRKTDYVYWSSPVASFNASAISPVTNPYYIWKWNPSIGNTNGGFGNWVNGNETMSVGKGYIVRGPDNYPSTATPYTATFNGVFNNGIKQTSITRGAFTGANYLGTNGATISSNDDNWNLIGNPFPSAIDAIDFLTQNTNIAGNVRLWTHGTSIALGGSTFYGSYAYNYSTSNYVNYNGTGSTPPGFNGKIGAAQGFFVLMNEATAVTENVTFNNSLRRDILGNAHNNSQFYRTANASTVTTEDNEVNKHLIWLSLLNSNNEATTTLIGYVDGATLTEDRLYDAPHKTGTTASIYSLITDKLMIIQGRPTPFNTADLVPVGVTIPSNGIYSIAISDVQGLFTNSSQNIYLEDTVLGIIHDLRSTPYSFTAVSGSFNNRFIVRYTNDSALGIDTADSTQTFAFIANNLLQVQSTLNIKEINVYDISGKLVKTYQLNELKNRFQTDFYFANGAYIAKIKLENGSIVSVKLLH